MDGPMMLPPRDVAPDTTLLPACLPVPGFGVLPVNAFLIHAAEPVLVDTGLAALRGELVAALESTTDLEALRWIWLTHADPDHAGNLAAVLERAPRARVVTTFLGMGKMGLLGLPVDRVHLVNPGQRLEAGDRMLRALRPPTFDAPETTALIDERTGALLSSDCFGALLDAPAERAEAVAPGALRDGAVTWATVDAPWLADVEPARLGASLDALRRLAPRWVLSSHLPPAEGMLDVLLGYLESATSAPRFEGPDQRTLERMMAGPQAA